MKKRKLLKQIVNMQQITMLQAMSNFELQTENGRLKHALHRLTHETQEQGAALERYHAKFGPLKEPDPKEVS